MALKARVETLRKQVKDTAARVSVQRSTAPGVAKQLEHESLQQAATALECALAPSSSEQAGAVQVRTPLTVSKAVSQAFVQDSMQMAQRAVALAKSLPDQVQTSVLPLSIACSLSLSLSLQCVDVSPCLRNSSCVEGM